MFITPALIRRYSSGSHRTAREVYLGGFLVATYPQICDGVPLVTPTWGVQGDVSDGGHSVAECAGGECP